MIHQESVLKELQRCAREWSGDPHMEPFMLGAKRLAANLLFCEPNMLYTEAERQCDEAIARGLGEWREAKAAKAASKPDVTCQEVE